MNARAAFLALTVAGILSATTFSTHGTTIGGGRFDWPVYRGDPAGTQYSSLAFIHAANVHTLKPSWIYHTGDGTQRSTMHVNPIVVGRRHVHQHADPEGGRARCRQRA